MEPRAKRHKKNIFKRISRWFAKLSKAKKIALITVAVLLITASGASAWYYNRLTDMEGLFPDVTWPGNDEDPNNDLTIDEAFKDSKIINIALLGFDSDEKRSETRVEGYTGLVDTIMVAAINIETGEIDVVSIPRDAYVPIYNYKGWKDKINSANWWGFRNGAPGTDDPVEAGLKSQLETISIALGGVKIHYYVTVNMDAVIEIVDIMGGVYLDVPERTYHKYGRVIAEPGYQWFSGRRFLDYVRSREASGGDYQRAKKQQEVMLQVFDQFKKANKLVNAPQVLASVRKNVNTNLSLEQIMALALFGTQKVNTSDIDTHVLKGSYAVGGIPGRREANVYYLVDHKAQAQLVREIWGIVINPAPADVLLPPLEEPADPSSEPNPSDMPNPDAPFDPTEPLPEEPGSPPGQEPGEDPPEGEDPEPSEPGDEDPGDEDPGSGDDDPEDPGAPGDQTGLDWGSSDPANP